MYVLLYAKLCLVGYKLYNFVLLCSTVLLFYSIVLDYCTISYCIVLFSVVFVLDYDYFFVIVGYRILLCTV